jgi:hypothetical protein
VHQHSGESGGKGYDLPLRQVRLGLVRLDPRGPRWRPCSEAIMSEQLEVFTADAVMTGTWPGDPDLHDVLESSGTLRLRTPTWTPHEEPGAAAPPDGLAVDDVIAVVGDSDSRLSIHANWHDVVIDAGPYRITAQLPVLPGFDPGRALARPGSTFLLLRDAKLELLGRPEAGELERAFVLVNRYAVDRVASDLVLGFFFPAAHFETLEGVAAG